MLNLTNVPNSPDFVEGIVNLRGKIIPIVDIKKRLNMELKKYDSSTRIIVVEINKKTVGFIVDEVNEVLRIDANVIEPPPEMVAGIQSEFITGVAKLDDRLMIMLDLNKILSKTEREEPEIIK